MNASLGNNQEADEDSWEAHAFGTVKGSDYLADQDAVAVLCQAAPAAVFEMEHWGTVLSRDDLGRIAQWPFGGAGFPRTCCAADRTGLNLLHTLHQQAMRRGSVFFEEHCATKLQVEKGAYVGFTAYNLLSGEMEEFRTNACLLGHRRLRTGIRSFQQRPHQHRGRELPRPAGGRPAQGHGVRAVPSHHPLRHQHPDLRGGPGGGGFNRHHERFIERHVPTAMELAPRHIVARAIQREIDMGNGMAGLC